MEFLTNDTPVWLTVGFFLLSMVFTILVALYVTGEGTPHE